MDKLATPELPVLIVAQPFRVARVGDRVVATLLDQIALLPVLFLAIFAIGIKNGEGFENGTMELHGGDALSAFFLIFLLWMTYYIAAEALFGGTLGKFMMGIKVATTLCEPITFGQAIVRNLLRPIDSIGLYLLGLSVAISSTNNQRVGDLAAGTMIFEAKTDRKFSTFLWIWWMAIGVGADLLATRFAL